MPTLKGAFVSPRMSWGGLAECKNISEAVKCASRALNLAGVAEPAASAEWIAAHVFRERCSSRALLRFDTSSLRRNEIDVYARLCEERAVRKTPVQYLVGEWDFHRITLSVRRPVLIPRPETEELVELVLRSNPLDGSRAPGPPRCLDVGCGSGAILIALLCARPTWYGIGLDVSEQAVALARENAKKNNVQDRCYIDHFDVASWPGMALVFAPGTRHVVHAMRLESIGPSPSTAVPSDSALNGIHRQELASGRRMNLPPRGTKEVPVQAACDDENRRSAPAGLSNRGKRSGFDGPLFDILVSNPPYIPPRDIASLPPDIVEHEDIRALAGGGMDGLNVVRSVLHRAPGLVRKGGKLWLEVDPSQPRLIEEHVSHLPSLRYDRTVNDFQGLPRFVCLSVV